MSLRRAPLSSLALLAGCAVLVAVLLGGCVTVAPHERGRLARRGMQPGGDADLSFGVEHAQQYREGSTGGGAVRGGGCGCN